MKLKWWKRKYTFVIIPDASRAVMQVRLPNFIAYFLPLLLLLTIAVALGLYIVHMKALEHTQKLQAELSGKTAQYEQTVADKDITISQLQNDVFQLSQQATEIKSKVDELKKLEKDILGITNTDAKDQPVLIASTKDKASLNGVGGSFFPLREEEEAVGEVISSTMTDFTSLDYEMKQLFDGLSAAKAKVLEQQHTIRITPSLWPTKSRRISSGFGFRKDPFTFRGSFHSGIDIAGDLNDPVYVTADGKVIYTGWDQSHGNNIIVNHTNGLKTRYMHLNKIVVEEGDAVEKGEKIGLVGSTGRSTGPHLHYEVIKNGESIDPAPYMTR